MTLVSDLDGHLLRVRGRWHWSDFTPEPRALDLHAPERFAGLHVEKRHVLVPAALAFEFDGLACLRDDQRRGTATLARGRGCLLVPRRRWRSLIVGAGFDTHDVDDVVERAVALGWDPSWPIAADRQVVAAAHRLVARRAQR